MKRVLICAIRVGVCREVELIRYIEDDAGVNECEDKVKAQRGYSMASGGGFGGVASPPS